MVMTFKPSDQQLHDRSSGDVPPQLPACAPLIYPSEQSGSSTERSKFRQMEHFVGDYGDRRARARFAQEHQDSTQLSGPAVTFRSRWGDPNNPATNGSGGLRGLITGQANTRRSDKDERKRLEEEEKQREKDEKRRRKGLGLIGGARSMIAQRSGMQQDQGLIGGMISQRSGMKQDQGLIKGIKAMGMQNVCHVFPIGLSLG